MDSGFIAILSVYFHFSVFIIGCVKKHKMGDNDGVIN